MADCFSLPNAAEIVEELREAASKDDSVTFNYKYIEEIADTIEELFAENATLKELYDKLDWERVKLKAERDAAVENLKVEADYHGDLCFFCKKANNKYYKHCNKCRWEWLGVADTNGGNKEEENG